MRPSQHEQEKGPADKSPGLIPLCTSSYGANALISAGFGLPQPVTRSNPVTAE